MFTYQFMASDKMDAVLAVGRFIRGGLMPKGNYTVLPNPERSGYWMAVRV